MAPDAHEPIHTRNLDNDLSDIEAATETLFFILLKADVTVEPGEHWRPSVVWLMEKLVADVARMRESVSEITSAIQGRRAAA